MAVNLIRKNNQENVTAYEDTVLFHLIKGENGVLPGVGDLFALSYNSSTKKMKVNSGMGMVYGRQFEIKEGEEVEMDWSALTGVKYISVYVEIDLRDPTNETATFKSTYGASAYPTITAGDNLITATTGVARMLMFWVYRSSTGTMSVTNKYTTYRNNWIANADYATNATNATNSTNSTKVGNNTITNSLGLRVTRSGQTKQETIECRRLLFSNSSGFNLTFGNTVNFSMSESVSANDVIEFHYTPILGLKLKPEPRIRSKAVVGYGYAFIDNVLGVSIVSSFSAGIGSYGQGPITPLLIPAFGMQISFNGTTGTLRSFINTRSEFETVNGSGIKLFSVTKIIGGNT